jgi:hypothetical protein
MPGRRRQPTPATVRHVVSRDLMAAAVALTVLVLLAAAAAAALRSWGGLQ